MRIIGSSSVSVEIEFTHEDLISYGYDPLLGPNETIMQNLASAAMPLVANTPLWQGGRRQVAYRFGPMQGGTYVLQVLALDTPSHLAALLSLMGMSTEGQQSTQQAHSCPMCGQMKDNRTVLVARTDSLDMVIDFAHRVVEEHVYIGHSSLFKLHGTFHLAIDVGDNIGVQLVKPVVTEYFETILVRKTVFAYYTEHAETIVAVDAIGNLARV